MDKCYTEFWYHAIPFKNLWDFFPQVLLTNVLVM